MALFASYCDDHRIKLFLTTACTPQQNGVVERINHRVVRMSRSLFKSMGVPPKFWGEARTTTVYLLSTGPSKKGVKGMTPYRDWHERKPSV